MWGQGFYALSACGCRKYQNFVINLLWKLILEAGNYLDVQWRVGALEISCESGK
jgi:hypothetical protein